MGNKKKQIEFKLIGIKTEQFATIEENYNSEKKAELSSGLQFKLDHKNKEIGVNILFQFLQEDKVFLKAIVSCSFRIEEEAWDTFLNDDKSKMIVPKNFITHLTVLSIGTARGVVFAKVENTEYSKFIIPTINVTKMIKKDIVFDLKKE